MIKYGEQRPHRGLAEGQGGRTGRDGNRWKLGRPARGAHRGSVGGPGSDGGRCDPGRDAGRTIPPAHRVPYPRLEPGGHGRYCQVRMGRRPHCCFALRVDFAKNRLGDVDVSGGNARRGPAVGRGPGWRE